jgi:hypothetical protein
LVKNAKLLTDGSILLVVSMTDSIDRYYWYRSIDPSPMPTPINQYNPPYFPPPRGTGREGARNKKRLKNTSTPPNLSFQKITYIAGRNRDLSPQISINILQRKVSLPTSSTAGTSPSLPTSSPAPARPTLRDPFSSQRRSIDHTPKRVKRKGITYIYIFCGGGGVRKG